MKNNKNFSKIVIIILVIGLMLGISLTVKAEKTHTQPVPDNDIVQYLKSRLKQQNVPFTQVKITQESPLEVEVTIQSLSKDDKFMSEDFINLHLVVREAVLSQERGYHINGLTEIVVNMDGKTIDWGWTKVADINYIKLVPSANPNNLPMDVISEKINAHRMKLINQDVSLFDGFKILNLHLSIKSVDEANLEFPQFIESLRSTITDANFNGAQVVMEKVQLRNDEGEILLNYLRDFQLMTEGWWAVDGFNTDSLRFSLPPPAP